jgi:hypothetical protein
LELSQVEGDDFGAAQSGGEQHVHDRAVPQRTGVPVYGGLDPLALVVACEPVEGVEAVQRPIGETELGSATDLLTVALEAGGAGSVLASTLVTWLRTRRTSARITVESAGRSVTLAIQTIADIAPLLEQVLRAGDDH